MAEREQRHRHAIPDLTTRETFRILKRKQMLVLGLAWVSTVATVILVPGGGLLAVVVLVAIPAVSLGVWAGALMMAAHARIERQSEFARWVPGLVGAGSIMDLSAWPTTESILNRLDVPDPGVSESEALAADLRALRGDWSRAESAVQGQLQWEAHDHRQSATRQRGR
jgi:hypothetical protein